MLSNHPEIASSLVSIDPACMKIENKNEQSVLHFAAENGKTEIASVLLTSLSSSEKSSLISSPDDGSWTAFHWSCSQGFLGLSKRLLEDHQIYKSESDPLLHTIRDESGNTPLMLDVLSNHHEIVSWLFSIDPACMKIQNEACFISQLKTAKLNLLLFF